MEAATMRTRIERRFNRSGPEENRSTSGASAAMYSSRVVAVSLTSRSTWMSSSASLENNML